MLRKASVVVAGVALAVIGAPAQAELIGFTLDDFPDIVSSFIDVTYDASGLEGVFQASGFALQYDPDGIPPGDPIVNGLFDLVVNIDKFSGEYISGNVTVGGNVGGFGPTLVTGDMTDFGFVDGGGMILDFQFDLTGGDLADDWGGIGQEFGVIMDIDGDGYSGDWTESFDNLISGIPGTGAGESDTATLTVVPGPTALALLAAAGLVGRRRRRG